MERLSYLSLSESGMHCCRALRGHRPTNSGSSVRASGTDEAISLLVRSNKPQVRVRHRAARLPFFWHATDLRPGSMTRWISKLRLQNMVTPMLFVRCGSAPCAWKAIEEEFIMLIRTLVCTSKKICPLSRNFLFTDQMMRDRHR